jgi:hypothetical protein
MRDSGKEMGYLRGQGLALRPDFNSFWPFYDEIAKPCAILLKGISTKAGELLFLAYSRRGTHTV